LQLPRHTTQQSITQFSPQEHGLQHGQQQERQAPHLSVKQQQFSVSVSCVPPIVVV
jgi:hypothetical protein